MRRILRCRMSLLVDLSDVFAFFADATNLERITPPELKFQIITPRPITINAGTVIDHRLKLMGIPFRWQSRITCWEPLRCFIDEQTLGPYKTWIHTHRFCQRGDETEIEDEVAYELPYGRIGEVLYPVVRLQLERIFRFRKRTITVYCGA